MAVATVSCGRCHRASLIEMPSVRQAVDRGKDKGLCLPVVPSQTAEDADSFYNFLIGAQTEAVLYRADAPRRRHIGRCPGPFCQGDRIRICPRVRVVNVAEQPHSAIVPAGPDSNLTFEYVAAIAEKAPIEPQAVSRFGHGCASVPQGPTARVELVYPAPGIPARIRRIIPCAVVHDGPSHELGPWVVGIPIVIK